MKTNRRDALIYFLKFFEGFFLLFGYRLGRKLTLVITGMLGGVFGLLKSLSPWYWGYIVLEFLEAAIGDNCSPMFILSKHLYLPMELILWVGTLNKKIYTKSHTKLVDIYIILIYYVFYCPF